MEDSAILNWSLGPSDMQLATSSNSFYKVIRGRSTSRLIPGIIRRHLWQCGPNQNYPTSITKSLTVKFLISPIHSNICRRRNRLRKTVPHSFWLGDANREVALGLHKATDLVSLSEIPTYLSSCIPSLPAWRLRYMSIAYLQ